MTCNYRSYKQLLPAALCALALTATPSAFALTRVATVIKGSIKVNNRTLGRRAPVYMSDTIRSLSKTTLRFTDNSVFHLLAGTTFKVSSYKYNPKSPGQDKFKAKLIQGQFRTVTGAIATSNPSGYAVSVGSAVIGVRGTDYKAWLYGLTSFIRVFSGTIYINGTPFGVNGRYRTTAEGVPQIKRHNAVNWENYSDAQTGKSAEERAAEKSAEGNVPDDVVNDGEGSGATGAAGLKEEGGEPTHPIAVQLSSDVGATANKGLGNTMGPSNNMPGHE